MGAKARDSNSPWPNAGGSFTISSSGVYGSLMSSPILNPPQSGILGMHKSGHGDKRQGRDPPDDVPRPQRTASSTWRGDVPCAREKAFGREGC
jgi:pyruvate/2-oxoglutarate dehydrogenase complex dihydrolipoamide acyltransferase (E2) component